MIEHGGECMHMDKCWELLYAMFQFQGGFELLKGVSRICCTRSRWDVVPWLAVEGGLSWKSMSILWKFRGSQTVTRLAGKSPTNG